MSAPAKLPAGWTEESRPSAMEHKLPPGWVEESAVGAVDLDPEELERANAAAEAGSSVVLSPKTFSNAPKYRPAVSKTEALSTTLSSINGAASSLTPKVAGAWQAVKTLATPATDWSMNFAGANEARKKGEADARLTVDQSEREHPIANVAGALAMPLPGPVKAVAAESLLARGLKYAPVGATVGGLNALGHSGHEWQNEVDGQRLLKPTEGDGGRVVRSSAAGGLLSGVTGPLSEAALASLSRWLALKADANAIRASGLQRSGISNKLKTLGLDDMSDAVGPDSLGRNIRESGLVPVGSSPAGVSERLEPALTDAAQKQAAAVEQADRSADGVFSYFNTVKASRAAKEAVKAKYGGGPEYDKATAPALEMIDNYAESGLRAPRGQTFRSGLEARQTMGGNINWKAPQTGQAPELPVQLQRRAYGEIGGGLKEQMASVDPDAAAKFSEADKRIALILKMRALANDEELRALAAKRDAVGNTIRNLGAGAGAATALTSSPMAGLGLAAAGYAGGKLAPHVPSLMMGAEGAASKLLLRMAPQASRTASQVGAKLGSSLTDEERDSISAFLDAP